MRRAAVMALTAALALAPSSWAEAQDDEDEEATEESETTGEDEEVDGEEDSEDETAEGEDAETGEDGEGDEKTATAAAREWFFGPYFRYVFVPAFMLELFLEEAPTVANPAFGIAANYRSSTGGPNFQLGIGYTSYAFEDPFRATGDPPADTEWVESDLGMLHVTGSILWSAEIAEKKLFFEYGIGLDVGILLGGITRTEAHINSASGQWEACQRAGVPDPFFCEQPSRLGIASNAYDEEGAHYGVDEERVPPIGLMPMVPHLALRYDPIEEVAIKLEAAYGIAQIWLGLSAAYAPEL
jgi:hypothetical protein